MELARKSQIGFEWEKMKAPEIVHQNKRNSNVIYALNKPHLVLSGMNQTLSLNFRLTSFRGGSSLTEITLLHRLKMMPIQLITNN